MSTLRKHWIGKRERLAIYMRDGMACVWCGKGVDDGAILSLDHVLPHSKGGLNISANLVTSCRHCNSMRGNRTMREFAKAVAEYRGIGFKTIAAHIKRCCRRDMTAMRQESDRLVSRQGGFRRALGMEV